MGKALKTDGVYSPALQLINVKKTYFAGENSVQALKGVSINFRKSEFVSILGPSGCGKTTMLNIIGGLDRYTEGDLVIEGKSTTNFSDRDWDTYRNHRIGFIFQSYNLIPHQTVLSNVELALTISGVGKEERVKLAKEALRKVGLEKEIYKRPNQLSGGQCQRVAIARALVNEPDILLADEPTGALDSKTSVQIMELIKEIAQDRLVIMVTHNGDLAKQYSSRIISLKDGEVIEDTNPLTVDENQAYKSAEEQSFIPTEKESYKPNKIKRKKRSKMSLWTSFKLSMRNLFTKKGRTALTSFAGSIGIIGISLILAVSQGATSYINHVQEATLSSYPITIESSSMDVMSLMESFMNSGKGEPDHPLDGIYKDQVIGELVDALAKANTGENDLASFKIYLDKEIAKKGSKLNGAVSAVQYNYDLDLDVYTKYNGEIVKSDTKELLTKMLASFMLGSTGSQNGGGIGGINTEESNSSFGMFSNMIMGDMWQELISSTDGGLINDMVKEQYDVVYGDWPTKANEVVLVLNEHNELDDLTLYALGLIGDEEIDKIIKAAQSGQTLEKDYKHWSYRELCEKEFKTILPYDCYEYSSELGIWIDSRENPIRLNALYDNAYTLKIKGIIRPNPESENHMIKGAIGYTYKLTEEIIKGAENSAVVQAQKASPNIDVFTGKPFESSSTELDTEQKSHKFHEYASSLDDLGKARLSLKIKTTIPEEQLGLKVMAGFQNLGDEDNQKAKKELIAEAYAQSMGNGVSADDVISMFENASKETIDGLVMMVLAQKYTMEYTVEKVMPYVMADQTGELGYVLEYAGLEKTLEKIAQDNSSALNTELSNLLNHEYGEDDQLCAGYYQTIMEFSDSTYENNLIKMGCIDLGVPTSINIYASSFENKDLIVEAIEEYNQGVDEAKKIKYTDYVGLLMSAVTTVIDAITYILIAFVAISLVVSSIMIAVITLISVQERTKEIGILRSIGASKRDVSSLFNAETIIIGLISGLLGVGVTYLLCIPINLILQALTGIPTLRAILPIGAAAILVAISVTLNLISGIIPSRSAAKKDPVVALRTE